MKLTSRIWIVIFVALVAGAMQTTAAQATKAKPSGASAPSKSQTGAKPKPRGGPQEGIKVHGDWTIIIRNPDGSVASRHEFHNDLIPAASTYLALVLAHRSTVGRWIVAVGDTTTDFSTINPTATGPCNNNAGPVDCFFVETVELAPAEVPLSGPDAGKLVLKSAGAAAVRRVVFAADLNHVQTRFALCSADVPASAVISSGCGTVGGFTAKAITPIHVEPGQAIDVKVVISFS